LPQPGLSLLRPRRGGRKKGALAVENGWGKKEEPRASQRKRGGRFKKKDRGDLKELEGGQVRSATKKRGEGALLSLGKRGKRIRRAHVVKNLLVVGKRYFGPALPVKRPG